jgi:hypothetical protein
MPDKNKIIFSASRTVCFDSDPLVIKFKAEFNQLDDPNTLNLSTEERKKKMLPFLTKTLRTIDETYHAVRNSEVPYEIYIPIYDRINQSHILAIHKHPDLDKLLDIEIITTKQKMLNQIREKAMERLRLALWNTKPPKAKKPNNEESSDDDDKYADLYNAIADAKKLPLFNQHLTNPFSFLRPKQTWSCIELDEKREIYEREQQGLPNPERISAFAHSEQIVLSV